VGILKGRFVLVSNDFGRLWWGAVMATSILVEIIGDLRDGIGPLRFVRNYTRGPFRARDMVPKKEKKR
jgi:hypothetical protein